MAKKYDKIKKTFEEAADTDREAILKKARELDTAGIDYKIINGEILITDLESEKLTSEKVA